MKKRLVVPVIFVLVLGSLAFTLKNKISDPISTTVRTTDGMVEGIRGKTGILSFKGIPCYFIVLLSPITCFQWPLIAQNIIKQPSFDIPK